MALIKHSFSALDQFANICERQCYYDRLLRVPAPPSIYLATGDYYHRMIAEFLNRGVVDFAEVLSATKISQGWPEGLVESTLETEAKFTLEKLKDEVFPHVNAAKIEFWVPGEYTAKIDVLSNWTPVVEDGKVIGHIEKQPCVIDWKTSFGKRRKQKDVDKSAQLMLYCLITGVRHAAFVEIPVNPVMPVKTFVMETTDYWIRRYKTYFDIQFAAMDSRGREESAYKLASLGHPLCCPKFCRHWATCPGGEGK